MLTTAISAAITYSDNFAKVGEGSTMITAGEQVENTDTYIRTDEIIDADINEKRRRTDIDNTRRVRSRNAPPMQQPSQQHPEIMVQPAPQGPTIPQCHLLALVLQQEGRQRNLQVILHLT